MDLSPISQNRALPVSSRPDPRLLGPLALLQTACLALASLIGFAILSAWTIPALRPLLPSGWEAMRPNTALAILCLSLGLSLLQPKRSARSLRFARILAIAVAVPVVLILAEYAFHLTLPIDHLLNLSFAHSDPGRMSPQSAVAILLLALTLILLRVRKRLLSYAADLLIFALGLHILTILSGYLFGAMHLVGLSSLVRTAPHSILCLALLAFVATSRRAEYGLNAIFLSIGLGGKVARANLPLALLLPFLLEASRRGVVLFHLLEAQYANALATSITSIAIVGFTLLLAWRIDTLETRIQDLSLRDPLTTLLNRRGFDILAEQALRLARRGSQPFSVVYLDLDHLKPLNDTYGHELGSHLLQTVAGILSQTFRETDVIGRIGGDEFVIAGEGSWAVMNQAVQRLEERVAVINAESNTPYTISFSLGCVTELDPLESLDQMLRRADKLMYEAKRSRKAHRTPAQTTVPAPNAPAKGVL